MKLTIIETGLAPAGIRDRFPSYPEMFRRMFADVGAGLSFETVSVVRGDVLPDPAELEAVLYTGSPCGVYDNEPWIRELLDFVRRAALSLCPQVGICFGHQLMAEALGGKVMKSEKGWGVGAHTYEISGLPYWSGKQAPGQMRVAASHQDQVVIKPASAECIAWSGFTPFAGLSYTGIPALSFQCHPEFDPEFSAALYLERRGTSLAEAQADAAIASLGDGGERRFLAEWITSFLLKSGTAAPG